MPEPQRSDYRVASVVQTIANANRGKGRAPIPLEDCKLDFDTSVKQQTPEMVMAHLKQFFEKVNAKKVS